MQSLFSRGRPLRVPRISIAPAREAVGSYIDTIDLIQDRKLDKALFERVQQSFGPGKGNHGTDTFSSRRESPTGFNIYHLSLHRPTEETVRLLSEVLRHGQRIHQVSVALDILVSTREQASNWQNFLEHRLVNPLGRVPVFVQDAVTYFKPKAPEGVRFALYSDGKCRLNDAYWACHLEARITGARTIERMKLSNAEGILRMNHRKFWDRVLDLRMPPSWENLARARNFSSNARTEAALGDAINRQAAQHLLNESRNAQGVVVAQSLLENMRSSGAPLDQKSLRRFRRERHDWLLPYRHSVAWFPEGWM